MGPKEPGLLVDTYHKLVASSVGELQCNEYSKALQKIKKIPQQHLLVTYQQSE